MSDYGGNQSDQPAAPGYPPGHAPYPSTVPPSRNGFAIAALVFGVFGGVLLAVIFGIVALHQIKRTGAPGRGMAIVGIVFGLGWTVLIGAGIAYFVAASAERNEQGAIQSSGTIAVADLEEGDCLADVNQREVVLSIQALPCTQPHKAEVYAVVNLDDGPWPGMQQLALDAETRCSDELAEGFPAEFEDRSVGIFYFHPTSASWREGDREVACVAQYTQGPRRGSIVD